MGLNTDLSIERADLEIEIERLLEELGLWDLEDFAGDLASLSLDEWERIERVRTLQCRLAELEELQRRYNRHLGEMMGNRRD
jgi:hypothetical protein